MAFLNTRQTAFIARLKSFAASIELLYGEAYTIKESYNEEFASEKDNALDNVDNLEEVYNFNSDDIAAAVNQAVSNFCTCLATHGKDLRRIK